ncbi:hypothetical protein JY97_02475 [Alkalispirochaeta odontotermitis]|nr:hypothetical protein JY97_02475 [Alkalispirochaeta odontotermitis]CAB1079582.1 hypothetical protein D1AOALGA4SA_7290 [Olavius algarvensis Delta 1 endosymbiont]
MKRSSFLKIGVFVFFSLVIASTSYAGGRWSKPGLPDIPGGWSEIDPAEVYPDFEYNGLTPACSACPTCMSDTFKPLDKFTFFAKKGTVNKLVIYFQGGGACWDSVNCLYAPTYTQQQVETIESFADTAGMGIFDTANRKNPFKNWYFVYIPYCTGDLHSGASDTEYTDIWDEIPGFDSWKIKHRGFVNFQVVLKWIKENFERPRKIFVTGISAGSYGAISGFPFIKEAFPLSKVYVLGDAGNGVTSEAFQKGGVDNWNVQVPDWIPGYEDGFNPEKTTADLYTDYANYYRWSKVAQYTTAWDETQAWFYNLQFGGLVSYPLEWDNFPYDPIYCGWHNQMLEYAFETADSARNYRYYIAAGTAHTIMMSPSFYTEESAGISFAKWVRAMVGGFSRFRRHYRQGPWRNLQCEDCEDPVVCP